MVPVHVGACCGQVPFVHTNVLLLPPSGKCHPGGQVYVAMVPKVSQLIERSALDAGAAGFRHGTGAVTRQQVTTTFCILLDKSTNIYSLILIVLTKE